MSKVILGMPGPWAKDYHEAADHYTTKVGGLPDWPIPEVDIRPDFLECGVCGSRLCLVAQIHAPVSSDVRKIEERTVYVFGCTMEKCGSNTLSWRALRVQKTNSEKESSHVEEVLSLGTSTARVSSNKWLEDIWTNDSGESNDALSNDDVDLDELSRAFSEATNLVPQSRKQTQKRSSAKSNTKLTDTNISVVPCFYIYSQEERLLEDVSAACSNYSPLSVKEDECDVDDHKEEERWDGEVYEYDNALFVDRTFMKFKKRMDAYPEQCFRYSYGGKPLLPSKELEVPANCGLCGGFRHYEIQLMPPLLYFLREGSNSSTTQSPEHWNWMTLIVYTCSKNCSHPSSNSWTAAEEIIIPQFE